jgi:hypothetical protein
MPTRKVMAATVTGVVVYAVTKLGVQLDPVIEQAINVVAMLVAAWLIPEAAPAPRVATLESRKRAR